MLSDDDSPSSPYRPHGNMLKPFKSLLTYLQKGSPNSSGSFGDDKEDEVEDPSEGNDALADDPLTDPLAFDHDYTALSLGDDEEQQDKESSSTLYHTGRSTYRRSNNNHIQVDFEDDDDDEEEDEGGAAEIVFVDINRLKAAQSPPVPRAPLPAPVSVKVPFPATDPQFPKEDRLKPGVEKPGTSSTAIVTTPPEDADASRSDGSDSGLGSELLNGNPSFTGCDQQPQPPQEEDEEDVEAEEAEEAPQQLQSSSLLSSPVQHQQPLNHLEGSSQSPLLPVPVVSIHRLRFEELPTPISPRPSTPPPSVLLPIARSALKRASLEDQSASVVDSKRARRNVQFDNVTIFYFTRIQGFLCVPSVGGCTLGMEYRHMDVKTMTLNEHLAEQRRAYRLQLEQLNPNLTRSQQQLQNQQQQQQNNPSSLMQGSSSDDSDEEASSASDVDAELTGFLRPVGTKQRRAMLKAAGVRKIEASEKDECRVIRESREVCGCRCQGYCDPELCYCSVNNIKCQVDRPNFPCSCTGECCGNSRGRVEFNPGRVRTHYIHTKMRLELEEKQQRLDGVVGGEVHEVVMVQKRIVGASSSSSSISGGDRGRDIVDYPRRPFESSNNSLSKQAEDAFVSSNSSSLLLARSAASINHVSSPYEGIRIDPITGHLNQLQQQQEQMILNRNSFQGDHPSSPLSLSSSSSYAASAGSYRDDYRPSTASLNLETGDGGGGSENKNNNSTGNQFCNNILQILGIQSTPPPPSTINSSRSIVTPPLVAAIKDYSPRRLLGQSPATGDQREDVEDDMVEQKHREDNNNRDYSVLSHSYLDGQNKSSPVKVATTESRPFVNTMPRFESIEGGDDGVALTTVIRPSDWPPRTNNNDEASNRNNTVDKVGREGEEEGRGGALG